MIWDTLNPVITKENQVVTDRKCDLTVPPPLGIVVERTGMPASIRDLVESLQGLEPGC